MRIESVPRPALALLVMVVAGLLAACASQPTPTPVPTTAPQKAPAPAATAAAPAATKAPEKSGAPAATPAAKAKASGTPFTLNYISALTGSGAFIGQSQKTGLEAFQKYINAQGGINGQPLEISILDDASNPRVSVQLANDLIAKKVPVILGPVLASSGAAVVPLVKNGPVLYLTGSGIDPEPNSYVFSALASNPEQYRVLLNFFKTKGWNKVAMLGTADANGQSVTDAIKDLLKKPDYASMSLVADEHADPGATSMAAQAAKIKSAGAQAVILAAVGAPITTMFKAVVQAGLDIPVGTSNGNQTYASMQVNKDILPAELYFAGTRIDAYDILPPGPAKDIQAEFRKGLAQFNLLKPDIPTSPTFDAAGVIVAALKKTGTDVTPAKLKEAIESVKGLEGVLGTYNMSAADHRGINGDNYYAVRWDTGKGTWVPVSGPGGLPARN
ncbi:MAG: ABC transporter substrate-binding protein [Chloroflexi bacterium]|nr:ABC transporter substrate-binding protein [Chloroflexota bacterium]